MSTEVLIAIVLVLFLSALALLLWYWKTVRDESRRGETSLSTFESESGGTDCPLCGEHLPRGVKVHSIVYPGSEFHLMRIHGCPHCWAGHPAPAPDHSLHRRRCPYCTAEIPENGYVMARVYQKPYRRTHVNVYGCTVCKPGRG